MQENYVVHPKYSNLAPKLRDILLDFEKQGEYIAQGDRNTIKRITLKANQLNIKSFKIPNVFQSFVYRHLRESKAKRSYEYALKLISFDIQTPFPIAYLERFSSGLKDSYYVSEHIDCDFDFRVLIHNPRFPNRDEILKQFARFSFKLHENNINFLDHSPGNTLIVDKGNNQYEFYLIDLNRLKFESLNFDQRMHNFRRLWLSKTMIKIMAEEYSELYGKTFEETHALMLKHSKNFQGKVNTKKLRRRKSRS